jgi:hypothetical protein
VDDPSQPFRKGQRMVRDVRTIRLMTDDRRAMPVPGHEKHP